MNAENVKINDEASGGDAGLVLDGVCPKCEMQLMIGESSWWDIECNCGYKWEVELNLKGIKK